MADCNLGTKGNGCYVLLFSLYEQYNRFYYNIADIFLHCVGCPQIFRKWGVKVEAVIFL